MKKLFYNPSALLTLNTNGKSHKTKSEMNDVGLLHNHSIIVENGIIQDIIPDHAVKNKTEYELIDLSEKTVLPGLIDCHTHTAFAGSRAEEFRQKISGVHYEEIAKRGGGINTTVKAVRSSSLDDIINLMTPRINYFISQGITTLEIKSGYGLNTENEIKLLNAIKHFKQNSPTHIVPTFLGAHTIPNELKEHREKYLDKICNEMIPIVAQKELAVFCDAFCESTAFSAEETEIVFASASEHGLQIKLHTEQFNNVGGIDAALKFSAASVDHLEVISESDIKKLCDIETVAVLLPGVSFFLNYQYAPARKLIDSGAIVALATDYNPGSSHIADLNLIMSLASLKMGMTIEETICAVTINAAKALNLSDKCGSIEIGKNADFSVFDTKDYADIVYNVGKNINIMTICNGVPVYERN